MLAGITLKKKPHVGAETGTSVELRLVVVAAHGCYCYSIVTLLLLTGSHTATAAIGHTRPS